MSDKSFDDMTSDELVEAALALRGHYEPEDDAQLSKLVTYLREDRGYWLCIARPNRIACAGDSVDRTDSNA